MTEGRQAQRGSGRVAATGPAWRAADAGDFREAMARLAAGVVVVTTRDASGQPQGLTATSLCSVSLDPPLVLTCIAHSASSHPAFMACRSFAVSVLRESHAVAASGFARSGPDKFVTRDLTLTPSSHLTLPDALCRLDCAVHARHRAGDHTILVGRVLGLSTADGDPLVYYGRRFRTLAP